MTDWVTPARSASSAWVRPASLRAPRTRTDGDMLDNIAHSQYRVYSIYAGSRSFVPHQHAPASVVTRIANTLAPHVHAGGQDALRRCGGGAAGPAALARLGPLPPRAGGGRERELLDRSAAAERHRRAAHGPRAQRLDSGRADPLSPRAR